MAKRGGYAEPFKDAPADFDFEDAERKARRGPFSLSETATQFERTRARAEGPLNAAATARVQAAVLTGLDGIAGSGAVVGGNALKELLFAKSRAGTIDKRASRADQKRKQVQALLENIGRRGDRETGLLQVLVNELGPSVRRDAYAGCVARGLVVTALSRTASLRFAPPPAPPQLR